MSSDFTFKDGKLEFKASLDEVNDRIKSRLEPEKKDWTKIGSSMADITLHRKTKIADEDLYEWFKETIPKNERGQWLCHGARVYVDEDNKATILLDPDLPNGTWIVTYVSGKKYRLDGVTGPIRRSEREDFDGDGITVEECGFVIGLGKGDE